MSRRRTQLIAYIGLALIAIVALAFATQPIIKRTVRQQITQRVTQELSAGEVCRKTRVGTPSLRACRELIDRIAKAATAKQEHDAAIRLFRTLTPADIRRLGLQGPRGKSGTTHRIVTTRTVIVGPAGQTTTHEQTTTEPPTPPRPKPPEGGPPPPKAPTTTAPTTTTPSKPPSPGTTPVTPGPTTPTPTTPPSAPPGPEVPVLGPVNDVVCRLLPLICRQR